MALIDKIEVSPGVWAESNLTVTNDTANDVISDSSLSATGEAIADVYELALSAIGGGTGTVTVSCQSKNNPYDGRVVASVAFDGATLYDNIIPGVILEFDAAATDTDTATVIVGQPQGAFDASGVGAGVPTAGVRHQVYNDGESEVADATVALLPQAVLYVKDHDLFKYIEPFADEAVEKIAGGGSDRVMPYAMKALNVTGAGPTKECDLEVDGAAFDPDTIMDITTGVSQDGTGLKAVDPPYPYLVIDGPLKGLVFAIHEDVANDDDANILIFNPRYVQIAEDVAGVEGTYGTVDVPLTQAGQSTGVIDSLQVAYYWIRTLVPASSNNESNPHPCSVSIQANEAQDAGWGV